MKNNTTKFHPILFATPMVQAILEGRKYQTRRTKGLESINEKPDAWKHVGIAAFGNIALQKNDFRIYQCFEEKATGKQQLVKCPYELDDVLWVRETFGIGSRGSVIYKANYDDTQFNSKEWKWKPSLFMPKEGCRIFLKIKSIRVERLQDISEEDAIAEGIQMTVIDNIKEYKNYTAESKEFTRYNDFSYPECAIPSFFSLWESINGKESLEKNPFVWVYQFQQIEKPLDFI
jgi:hypothetical protein